MSLFYRCGYFLLLGLLPGCRNSAPEKPLNIVLQPLGQMDQKQLKYVHHKLLAFYPHISIGKSVDMPGTAYVASRNRYRADSILRYLGSSAPAGQVTVGLTSYDISTKKGEIPDYGIMGLAIRGGNACVVSTWRLSKKNLEEQLFKVTIHELGHTQGLSHCPQKNCYMRDAEGGNPTDDETGFCEDCQEHLSERGWTFKKQDL